MNLFRAVQDILGGGLAGLIAAMSLGEAPKVAVVIFTLLVVLFLTVYYTVLEETLDRWRHDNGAQEAETAGDVIDQHWPPAVGE